MNKTTNPVQSTFDRIYRDREWRGGLRDGTVSGAGSTLGYTREIREALPTLINDLGIESMLDAPCGDFHWMQHVQFPEHFRYIGGDIVRAMVQDLQDTHAGTNRLFLEIDITVHPLPDLDLWFCRDCLFHLPFACIEQVFENYTRSGIRYFMATTHPTVAQNRDCDLGGFRPLSLAMPPINLPEPVARVGDGSTNNPPREMWVWERSQLLERKVARDQVVEDVA